MDVLQDAHGQILEAFLDFSRSRLPRDWARAFLFP